VKAGLQRQVRLLRDGTAVAGDVTSIKTKQTNYGPSFVLRYRYTARDGAEHSGSLPVSLAVRDRYVGPGPGKSLTVLYDRNNPRDSVPYAYAASFAELERDERRAASRAGSSESNLSASASVSGRLQ